MKKVTMELCDKIIDELMSYLRLREKMIKGENKDYSEVKIAHYESRISCIVSATIIKIEK